jgi:16S rRNA processing protein RimM
VVLAEVDRPRGLEGEVLARLHADDPSRLDGVEAVEIVGPDGSTRPSRLVGWKRCGERVVLRLQGIETVEAARSLAGAEIRVAHDGASVRPPEGRYFAHQIEGLQVVTKSGEPLGVVERVMRPAGQTLLEVRGSRGSFLLPMVAAICVEIDPTRGRIVVDPPEGLIELNAV